jgi:hypothetical protein
MFNIYFHNLSEAERSHGWFKKLEGVEKVKMRIMKIGARLNELQQKRLNLEAFVR